jgi:hypothetical protein
MSATVTTREARVPVTRFGGQIAAAMIAIAMAAAIGIAALAFVLRDTGPAPSYDPTNALRLHVVREYGSSATYDATGAIQTHVLRENDAAPAGTLFDHVVRENSAN